MNMDFGDIKILPSWIERPITWVDLQVSQVNSCTGKVVKSTQDALNFSKSTALCIQTLPMRTNQWAQRKAFEIAQSRFAHLCKNQTSTFIRESRKVSSLILPVLLEFTLQEMDPSYCSPESFDIKLDPTMRKADLPGLPDIGNSCYMNALLQVIRYTPSLQKYFSDEHQLTLEKSDVRGVNQSEEEDLKRRQQIKNLIRPILSSSEQVSPQKMINIRKALWEYKKNRGEMYLGLEAITNQADASELWILLADLMEIPQLELSTAFYYRYPTPELAREYPEVEVEKSRDPLIELEVSSFETTLSELFKPKQTERENYLTHRSSDGRLKECPEGVIVTSTPSLVLGEGAKAPQDILIHLKRFAWNPDGTRNKINTSVQPDQEIRLPIADSDQCAIYRLKSCVKHIGSLGGGHYTSYVKLNNDWFYFDNSTVSKCLDHKKIYNDMAHYGYIFGYDFAGITRSP